MVRFNLPDIDFTKLDVEDLERAAVKKYESLMGVTLKEADPRRKQLQAAAYMGMIILNNIDYTAKQNRLSYAEDDFLEHIGVGKKVDRLEPIAAKTTERYHVNNPEVFVIPSGHRIGVGGLFFATTADYTVPVGVQYVDIELQCTEAGTIGNDFLPGQITEIVDPLPWVVSVENITKSEGGMDWETDDAYAARIRDSNESLSTAGPELAYEYFAKSANQKISDVKVTSPNPSEVEIFILMKNGELPTEEEKNQVLEICSARNVRPLTDKVSVSSPELYYYDFPITYYLPQSLINTPVAAQSAVSAAVEEYKTWQKEKLGRGIDPGELYARLQKAGAKRISLINNHFIPLADNQVAREGNVTLTFGGFIND